MEGVVHPVGPVVRISCGGSGVCTLGSRHRRPVQMLAGALISLHRCYSREQRMTGQFPGTSRKGPYLWDFTGSSDSAVGSLASFMCATSGTATGLSSSLVPGECI